MDTVIQYVHAKRDETSEAVAQERLDELGQRFDWITRAQVIFKSEKHSPTETALCEIELSVPGPRLFAKEYDVDFLPAFNKALDELKTQLEKKKAKMYKHSV